MSTHRRSLLFRLGILRWIALGAACTAAFAGGAFAQGATTTPSGAATQGSAPAPTDPATQSNAPDRSAPPMTERTISFQTSEVTEASVDVSPDGKWLVFTLLGDLYRLPIEGGTAEALTEGWPADQGPRISPDGASIAFVSDRDGEGIYLYDLAKKSTRLVSSKVSHPSRLRWTSDSAHLAVEATELVKGKPTRRLMQVDVKSGAANAAPVTEVSDDDTNAARRASPSGTRIASILLHRDAPDDVVVMEKSTGERHVLDAGVIRSHDRADQVPDFAWLPDESALVLSGGGGLRIVPIDGSPARVIPFQANVRFSRLDGPRAACLAPVAKRIWNPRGVPDLAIAPPSGKMTVFSSAGDLFIAPFRTAKGEAVVAGPNWEFRPLWAQDARGLVYQRFDGHSVTTWLKDIPKSEDKSTVLNLRTPEHEIVEPKGRYTLEAWHPDGERMLISQEAEGVRKLSILDPSTGETVPLWTTTSSVEPHAFFGPVDQDLYFTDLAENGAPNLFKVALSTLDKATQVTFFEHGAEGSRLSPDQTQVLFRRNFGLYAAPSKTTAGGPRDRDAERISESADGPYGWFFNSKNAFNIDGATFQGIRVSDQEEVSFNVENIFGLPPKGPSAVLEHIGVVDVENGKVLEDQTIVIADGRFERIVAPSEAAGAQGPRLDCSGLYAMPGLVEMKAQWGEALPRQLLACGITTVLDRGTEMPRLSSLRDGTDAGLLAGPRYFGSGPCLDLDGTASSYLSIESAQDADDAVRHLSERGVEWIELGDGLTRAVRRAAVASANAHSLPAGFGASNLSDLCGAIGDGVHAVHGTPGGAIHDDVIQLLKQSSVAWSPGLGSIGGLNNPRFTGDRESMTLSASSELIAGVSGASEGQPSTVKQAAATSAARAAKAGVHVVCASDSPGRNRVYGATLLGEIEDLVSGGLAPAEALHAATLAPIQTLGLDAALGSIAPGKLADLVVLAANPLADIHAIEGVVYVMREGRMYKHEDLLVVRGPASATKPK